MRADMSKVLVEEPRSGRAHARAIEGSRRRRRNHLDPDGEGGPARLGMTHGGRSKWFSEHLGPLHRYLRQQVDRPWDKVYGELCATLDRRSVVQAHLFQHIADQVDVETTWHDGQVWVRSWRGRVPLAQSRAEMYVHPRTGILLVNRARVVERRRRKAERVERSLAREQDRRAGAPLPANVQWHRIDGLWYELRLRTLAGTEPAFDAVLRRLVTPADGALLRERYGTGQVYAHAKRQLGGRTLRQHGLAAD